MSYQGADGLYTVFPTGKKSSSSAPSARGAKKSKAAKPAPYGRTASGAIRSKPCANGPSPARGNCPKLARTTGGRAKQVTAKIFQAGTGKSVRRGSIGDAVSAAGGAAAAAAARKARASIRGTGGANAAAALAGRLGPKAAAALGFTGIGAVGLVAYFITKRILENRAAARADRAERAFLVAQAYREARNNWEGEQGKPLNLHQLTQLSDAFKEQLREIGFETDNLKGL